MAGSPGELTLPPWVPPDSPGEDEEVSSFSERSRMSSRLVGAAPEGKLLLGGQNLPSHRS